MFSQFLTLVRNATITLPAVELTLLLGLLTLTLVFRMARTGLMVGYLFVYYWGWNLFVGHRSEFMIAYLVFGGGVGVLTVIGMLRGAPDRR
jgi:hypothetical protein